MPRKRTIDHVLRLAHFQHLEGAAVLGMEMAVVADRRRLVGKGFDAHFAAQALRARRSCPSGQGFRVCVIGRLDLQGSIASQDASQINENGRHGNAARFKIAVTAGLFSSSGGCVFSLLLAFSAARSWAFLPGIAFSGLLRASRLATPASSRKRRTRSVGSAPFDEPMLDALDVRARRAWRRPSPASGSTNRPSRGSGRRAANARRQRRSGRYGRFLEPPRARRIFSAMLCTP